MCGHYIFMIDDGNSKARECFGRLDKSFGLPMSLIMRLELCWFVGIDAFRCTILLWFVNA